jgi:hypothetical protein
MRDLRQAMSATSPESGVLCCLVFAALCVTVSQPSLAMGLRSFVALPVEKGGQVLRIQLLRNFDANIDQAIASLAWGIDGRSTLLFDIPYRLSPGGSDQLGDLSALYRRTVWQVDSPGKTSRLAWLGGVVIPTDSKRDTAVQAGAVATFYRGRFEWDLDILYQAGQGNCPNSGRYDISWQYRLTPSEYPEWGLPTEWHLVLELGGRYRQDQSTVHQVTSGLQWIHPRWVLEAGITRDLNGPEETTALLGARWHF